MEENKEQKKKRTPWKEIIGGDILATNFFRRQTKLLVLIVLLVLFYIHNRYACQQQLIELDKLKKELTDIASICNIFSYFIISILQRQYVIMTASIIRSLSF